jgi:hypothetical protein
MKELDELADVHAPLALWNRGHMDTAEEGAVAARQDSKDGSPLQQTLVAAMLWSTHVTPHLLVRLAEVASETECAGEVLFRKGLEVEAWRQDAGWQEATVEALLVDGTVKISWADGDTADRTKSRALIRPVGTMADSLLREHLNQLQRGLSLGVYCPARIAASRALELYARSLLAYHETWGSVVGALNNAVTVVRRRVLTQLTHPAARFTSKALRKAASFDERGLVF